MVASLVLSLFVPAKQSWLILGLFMAKFLIQTQATISKKDPPHIEIIHLITMFYVSGILFNPGKPD